MLLLQQEEARILFVVLLNLEVRKKERVGGKKLRSQTQLEKQYFDLFFIIIFIIVIFKLALGPSWGLNSDQRSRVT